MVRGNLKRSILCCMLATCMAACIILPAALGENTPWDCPGCGKKGNVGNFCGSCGHPAPWKEQESNAEVKYSAAPFKTDRNIVTFGRYEQDNNTGNGQEAIEWIVLDVQDGKSLLLSRYGLDAKPYNTEYTDITWENCTLRKWLNEDFLQAAFTEKERSAILETEVDNSKAQGFGQWSTDGGNNTQDYIFLLSYAEANKYLDVAPLFFNNLKSRVAPTAFAKTKDVWLNEDELTTDGEPAGSWWLRSPGDEQHDAAFVHSNGMFVDYSVDNDRELVRPAFWINLESDIF